ncbi:MAG: DUF1643 domain-containing protein [Halobellus sp.]|uniref:DUF1643 domain-containing protein n=1 Tax=Halobellus sp. TaxID=1979212 RepID=UPI0035D4DB72
MAADAIGDDDRRVASCGSDGAVFSPAEAYRYCLWRTWDPSRRTVAFIALNPSTADAHTDDRTVSTCVRFARDWGYGRLILGNLFAYRATDPAELKRASDPVGPRNDDYLRQIVETADRVIAAWGVHGTHRDRASDVVAEFDVDFHALTTTQNGHPGHPLRKAADLEPEPWP